MRLSPEAGQWLIRLRWVACAGVVAVVWVASSVLGIVPNPLPLYLVAVAMMGYNLYFERAARDWATGEMHTDRLISRQIVCDLLALTALLYFSDLSRNPFIFFYVFHMIIGSMYLHGRVPYYLAGMAILLVGSLLLLEYLGWIPLFALRFPADPPGPRRLDGLFLLGQFAALASTLWITVYFTTSIHRYVDRAHAELRQKEKMLGIGQLVAGIAHQIANPLDGVQNCLRIIGERVKHERHLTEYIRMMGEALDRIERTAKRVQAFARPRGITLQRTDVNAAVEATLQVLGTQHGPNIKIQTHLGAVPEAKGDPYTLQEVLFNLCTNALAAMPGGGALTITTAPLEGTDEDEENAVAIHVADTGVGIARVDLEKVFEPFYTTRADKGGTGLGLGLCRMLISEMGGRIQVRSALGQGTTFTVILDAADERTAVAKS